MLFQPFKLAGLELRNRMVRSATFEKMADENGFVTGKLVRFYECLAHGGSGLIITGNSLVHHSGRTLRRILCVHSDLYLEGLRRLSEAVHREGGTIALQLNHGGRQCRPVLLGGKEPIAPSAVYDPSTKTTPRAMTDSEIWDMVEAFGEAAWRARAAGFDGVQLHAAHGYLLSNFLSPHTNRRNDYWGGDEERRFHFVEEVMKSVRKTVGGDYPVLIKLNADDFVPGGIQPQESVRHAVRLQTAGLDAVEISAGTRESTIPTIRPNVLKPAEEAYLRGAGKLFTESLNIPVILTGGMRSQSMMEEVLQNGEADLIGLSRPLLREPNLPNLMKEGKEKADCISCNKCTRFARLPQVKCKFIENAPSRVRARSRNPDAQSN